MTSVILPIWREKLIPTRFECGGRGTPVKARASTAATSGPTNIRSTGSRLFPDHPILKTPESKSPYNQNRLTASSSFFKGDERNSLAWTAAIGQNREVFGNLAAYLLEGT